jgi:hypothetical protein
MASDANWPRGRGGARLCVCVTQAGGRTGGERGRKEEARGVVVQCARSKTKTVDFPLPSPRPARMQGSWTPPQLGRLPVATADPWRGGPDPPQDSRPRACPASLVGPRNGHPSARCTVPWRGRSVLAAGKPAIRSPVAMSCDWSRAALALKDAAPRDLSVGALNSVQCHIDHVALAFSRSAGFGLVERGPDLLLGVCFVQTEEQGRKKCETKQKPKHTSRKLSAPRRHPTMTSPAAYDWYMDPATCLPYLRGLAKKDTEILSQFAPRRPRPN